MRRWSRLPTFAGLATAPWPRNGRPLTRPGNSPLTVVTTHADHVGRYVSRGTTVTLRWRSLWRTPPALFDSQRLDRGIAQLRVCRRRDLNGRPHGTVSPQL